MMGELMQAEPMNRHTSWRVGGNADRCYRPSGLEDLSEFLRALPKEEPVEVVGLGSNLLVRDGGIRGTVILMHKVLDRLCEEDGLIHAQAGVACAKVARFSAQREWRGAEFLAGIPGTIGGALAMNAGCYGGETWNIVEKVEAMGRDGVVKVRYPEEYRIGYRSVVKPAQEWFVSAWFRLVPGKGGMDEIRSMLKKRIASQPLSFPNAGSVFRNPEGNYAARLIESCGLKGKKMGGAMVSEKHANFIVNTGTARASDIENLIEFVQEKVLKETGIRLEREVRIIGEAA
ncbi:MAG: UDP-N-acetylmuramate dehydrogenase [Burkholderiales bacterium]